MLSGPRHLLSVLALGMRVLDRVVDPPVLSFLCFVSFVHPPSGFLVSFVLPLGVCFVVSLGLLAWGGIAGGLRVTPRQLDHCRCCGGSPLLSYSFFFYSWPLGHREASKRVVLELA